MPISHVFDTYATTAKGRIMHFDVILAEKDADKAIACAKEWLASIGEADAEVNHRNCVFCHSAQTPADLCKQMDSQGYGIYKMEGCPK